MSCSASPKNRQSRVQRQSINRHRRAQDKNLNTRLLQGKTHYKSTYEGEQEQPIETKKYRPACHPHQNKWSFPKKPASGGRPPRDKRHRAKERAKKGSFVYNPA